ncbi:riboflavin synthase [Shimazuella sp. AN120528]|uniref:riboflavin synthase n=1 Tax=Shimazuella soli TaxID=1892854 RepID=UPI001F0CF0E9|nr:riboflavin synthase [Shimazuella soli]MCH5584273.1 riboflavin synthase [Shimazuella soli]
MVRIYALLVIPLLKEEKIIFTGLIEEVGRVVQIIQSGDGMELTISCSKVLENTNIGDSIAVNGVCLTVTEMGQEFFVADVMAETVRKSGLANYRPSTVVNLERAMKASDRLGGHIVQGHVDGVATVLERLDHGSATYFQFQSTPEIAALLVETGSIAINGVSLTLTEVIQDTFAVSLIPHTLYQTQFKVLQVGELVNIECDIIGKYLFKWRSTEAKKQVLDKEKLAKYGF